MNQLMIAIKRAQAMKTAELVAAVVVYIVLVDIILMNNTEQDVIILTISFGLAITIGVLMRCFCCYEHLCLNKIKKLIASTPNSDGFFDTFTAEMGTRTAPDYYNKKYRLSIFATDTWFVLIAADDSIIRRRDTIKSTEQKFIASNFTHAAKINFADGYFICHCDHIHEDVVAVVRSIIRDDVLISKPPLK